jgi:hypothetical protein
MAEALVVQAVLRASAAVREALAGVPLVVDRAALAAMLPKEVAVAVAVAEVLPMVRWAPAARRAREWAAQTVMMA